MEPITRSNPRIRKVGPENGGGNDPKLEGFSSCIDKIFSKVNQLEQRVNMVEQRRVEEEAAAQLTVKLAQEASHGKMARDLRNELYEIDMHLEKLREMVVQKCRKITTEDKKKMWGALNRLPREGLIRALEIVAENNPSFQAAAEEVDLDIDVQSELTLWRLKVFIEDALKVTGRYSVGMNGNNHWNDKNEDKNKNNSITAAATTTKKNNSKQRREICGALTKTANKRTKKISLIS